MIPTMKAHWSHAHPLAEVVRRRCTTEHPGAARRSGVPGCPLCFEWAVRQDAVAGVVASTDTEGAATPDQTYVDEIAIEMYLSGKRHGVRLNPAERVCVVLTWMRRDPNLTVSTVVSRTAWTDVAARAAWVDAAAQLAAEQAAREVPLTKVS